MKPFEYVAARTIDEAVEALASSKGPAKPLAGGTDLVVQLNEGRITLDRVVDIGRIPELKRVDVDAQGQLRLGAAAPCVDVYSHLNVQRLFPMLVDSASIIGSVQVQSRASIGGNLCNASPSGDSIPTLICLGAQAVIQGPSGRRVVPVEEFCTGPGQTVLQPAELVVEIVVPAPGENEGGKYLRFIPRNEMDIAVVGVGSWIRWDPRSGCITDARIALGAVAPTPVRAPEAEAALIGKEVSWDVIDEASRLAVNAARPISDVRGSAEYRRHLVSVLVRRTLLAALERAGADVKDLGRGEAYAG